MDRETLPELLRLLKKISYREGDFTLASGRKSTFYLDVKTTALHPDGAHLIGRLAVEMLEAEILGRGGLKVEGVGGLTLGADPIGTAISLSARERGMHWPAFIVRKEPKKHGNVKYIEGVENLRPGCPLLVVEDVVTTGGSSLIAVERLREAGYNPVAVWAVVDRMEGGADEIRKAGLRFFAGATIDQVRKA